MAKGELGGKIENTFKPFPEGMYQGRVTKLEIRTSKAGNDYINVEFSLMNNRKVWDKLMFHTDGCKKVSAGKLDGFGFTQEERHQLDPDDIESILQAVRYMIADKTYDVKVKIEDDQNKVSYFTDPNAVEESDPLDPAMDAPVKEKKPRIQSPWG